MTASKEPTARVESDLNDRTEPTGEDGSSTSNLPGMSNEDKTKALAQMKELMAQHGIAADELGLAQPPLPSE